MKREFREANARKGATKPQLAVPDTLALEAARLKIAERIAAKAKPATPPKVESIPTTPGAKRADNSPYRKESRK